MVASVRRQNWRSHDNKGDVQPPSCFVKCKLTLPDAKHLATCQETGSGENQKVPDGCVEGTLFGVAQGNQKENHQLGGVPRFQDTPSRFQLNPKSQLVVHSPGAGRAEFNSAQWPPTPANVWQLAAIDGQ